MSVAGLRPIALVMMWVHSERLEDSPRQPWANPLRAQLALRENACARAGRPGECPALVA